MDESEKRGPRMLARRQQQQAQINQHQQLQKHSSASVSASLFPTTLPFYNRISQQRPKRKLSDQTSIGLPEHLDFSFRDFSDATAKRRFQVKVPCRLLLVLILVFLLIPGLIFLYKEFHIHENHFESHYKTEKYINVKTDEVFLSFRQATANQTTAVHLNGTVDGLVVIVNHTSYSDMKQAEPNKIDADDYEKNDSKVNDYEGDNQNEINSGDATSKKKR